MPPITCRNCGYTTNTTLSDWINSNDDKADSCYATFINGKREKSCGYEKADNFTKQYVDKLIYIAKHYNQEINT